MEKEGGNAFAGLWLKYATFVEEAIQDENFEDCDKVIYWRKRLFTKFITYLLPSCIVALVPGVLLSVQAGYFFVAFSDISVVVLVAIVSCSKGLSFNVRKLFVALTLYYLAIVLIVNLSLLGPGLVYLLSISIIISVTYTRRWAYWTIATNFLICILCALIIHLKLFNSPLIGDYTLPVWITVSSNLIFLSFVIVMLVTSATDGLENAILKERLLQNELDVKTVEELVSLKKLIESQNQYKSLFVLNPSPMWILAKKDLSFLQVNEAAINNYGYTEEEFLSMTVGDIKLKEHAETVHADLKKTWNQASHSVL